MSRQLKVEISPESLAITDSIVAIFDGRFGDDNYMFECDSQ